ncbi:hypothetical protein [Lentilactobacillus parabuchneri]|uniref:hypothetical protein n=1 Tax=Lentilactobacillus parabuchneri TaxID=152331 RepID=UPI0009476B1C|nr:hypothetical protein [Lentilactobacillus parabuchneri]APR07360.1 hypothetical protein FAM21731_01168 [Lentilactobacillus parabuchneri]
MNFWPLIWSCLFISLFSTGGFGILNVFNICCKKDAEARFSVAIQRKISRMYIMVPALNEENEIVATVDRLLRVTILIGMALIFLVVEVQSRYQVAFYLPWLILSVLGMDEVTPQISLNHGKECLLNSHSTEMSSQNKF